MIFYGVSKDVSMVYSSMAFLWDFKSMSLGFPLDSYGVSLAFFMIYDDMGFLWGFHNISIGFL